MKKDIIKMTIIVLIFISPVFLSLCSCGTHPSKESSEPLGKNNPQSTSEGVYKNNTTALALDKESDLPECTKDNDHQLIYIKAIGEFKSCEDNIWVSIEISNGVDGKDGLNGKDGVDGADGSDGEDGTDSLDFQERIFTTKSNIKYFIGCENERYDRAVKLCSTEGWQIAVKEDIEYLYYDHTSTFDISESPMKRYASIYNSRFWVKHLNSQLIDIRHMLYHNTNTSDPQYMGAYGGFFEYKDETFVGADGKSGALVVCIQK